MQYADEAVGAVVVGMLSEDLCYARSQTWIELTSPGPYVILTRLHSMLTNLVPIRT